MVMTLNGNSEYENSYTHIPSAQEEYYERLRFRINKRNNEYSHHPFLWDNGDDAAVSDSTRSVAVDCICVDPTTDYVDEYSIPVEEQYIERFNGAPRSSSNPYLSNNGVQGLSIIEPNITKTQKDQCRSGTRSVCTQTQRFFSFKPIVSKKAFVPYAIGVTPSPLSDIRRTFNVKSERDVHPSAIRAEALRRERIISGKQIDMNGPFPKNSSQKVKSKKSEKESNRKPSQSDSEQDNLRKSIVNNAVTKYCSPKPVVSLVNNVNSGGDSQSKTNIWSSEYHQKYPIYPSSVYVRSASVAASRCRPLSSTCNRPASSTFIRSLVPSTPVLLSSRGSNHVGNRIRETYCGVCAGIAPDGRCIPQILSAR